MMNRPKSIENRPSEITVKSLVFFSLKGTSSTFKHCGSSAEIPYKNRLHSFISFYHEWKKKSTRF